MNTARPRSCISFITRTHTERLTADVQGDGLLSVFDAVHDLAAVRACITGPEPLYGQRRVALVLRNPYPVFKLRPDLEEPVLGHKHCDFLIAHQFGPLDAEMVLVGGAAGRRREDGEIAGQHHLLRQRAPHPTSGVCKQQADGGEERLSISAGSFETTASIHI